MDTKRTLILIKHSEPVLEPGVAPNRWRLSEKGRQGSVLLGEYLARYRPGAVVCSEEPKAVETARLAAVRLGVDHLTFPGLHEHDRTGGPFLSAEDFDQAARTFFANPGKLVWGNETAEQALERFDGAVRAVLEARGEEAVAVVAHGTVISLFVAQYNDIEAYELWRQLRLPSFCVLSTPGFELREAIYDLKPEATLQALVNP